MSSPLTQPALREIPVDRVRCERQVRETFGKERGDGLAENLGETGLLQPIRVRPAGDGWIVIDGERRLRAAQKLGWATILALVDESTLSPADIVWHQLSANLQRDDLSPMEVARGIDQLIREAKWSADQVAARLGLSAPAVSKLRALLVLPADIQEAVHTRQLPASTAYEIAKVRDPKERARLIARALKGDLTRDGASLASKRRARARAARSKPETVAFPLGGGLHLAVAGDSLTLGDLCARLGDLVTRLNTLAGSGMSLDEAARKLASNEDGELGQPAMEVRGV